MSHDGCHEVAWRGKAFPYLMHHPNFHATENYGSLRERVDGPASGDDTPPLPRTVRVASNEDFSRYGSISGLQTAAPERHFPLPMNSLDFRSNDLVVCDILAGPVAAAFDHLICYHACRAWPQHGARQPRPWPGARCSACRWRVCLPGEEEVLRFWTGCKAGVRGTWGVEGGGMCRTKMCVWGVKFVMGWQQAWLPGEEAGIDTP